MLERDRHSWFRSVAVVVGLTLAPAVSEASYKVTLSQSGYADLVIVDNSAGDANANSGIIEYSQNYGAFSTTAILGTSNSADGVLPAQLFMSALSVKRRGGHSGGVSTEPQTLTITMEDSAFSTPEGYKTLLTSLERNHLSKGVTVTLQAFIDGEAGTLLTLDGKAGNPGQAEVYDGPFSDGTPFDFKLVMTLTISKRNDRFDVSGLAEITDYDPYSLPPAQVRGLSNDGSGLVDLNNHIPNPAPSGLIMLLGALPFFGLLRRKHCKCEPTATS